LWLTPLASLTCKTIVRNIKIGRFIPQSEQWIHSDTVKGDLDEAIMWAEKNPPQASDLNEIEERIKV
jgi:hypothetical protein